MEISRRSALQHVLLLGVTSCELGCRSLANGPRRQLLLLPEPQEVALGRVAYHQALQQAPASTNQAAIELVNRVGLRLARAAERPAYAWEFRLLASPARHAFCLPGGKMAVCEGLLPSCVHEAGLAVVMSHEIAHVLARHGGERMSRHHAAEGTWQMIRSAASRREPSRSDAALQAYGVATAPDAILPYSREQELEADQMGLVLMAKAGYDPAEAARLWPRLAASGSQGKLPEYLATHPSDASRMDGLEKITPLAVATYSSTPEKHGLGAWIADGPQAVRATNIAARDPQPGELPSPPAHARRSNLPEPIEAPLVSYRERYEPPFSVRWVR